MRDLAQFMLEFERTFREKQKILVQEEKSET